MLRQQLHVCVMGKRAQLSKGTWMSKRNTFEQRLLFFTIISNKCFVHVCRKLILTYKFLQGVFGMKDIDFMCFEKPFPSRRGYSLHWWKELMACVNRYGVLICKIKRAFSDVNSWIILIFSHTFTSVRLIIKNLECFTYLSPAAFCMHYCDINLLQFSQIEFKLSTK